MPCKLKFKGAETTGGGVNDLLNALGERLLLLEIEGLIDPEKIGARSPIHQSDACDTRQIEKILNNLPLHKML
jgi:hypothetical protein